MTDLFRKCDWHSFIENNKSALKAEISDMDGNRLLNTAIDDLVEYLIDKYNFDVPVLLEDEITVSQDEVDIDVSGDSLSVFLDSNKPFFMKGIKVNVFVPFRGESVFFSVQPSSFYLTIIRGDVRESTLVYSISRVDLTSEQAKSSIEKFLKEVKEYLDTQRKDAVPYNNNLEKLCRTEINARKDKLLKDRNLVANLGFKLAKRENDAYTFAAPDVRKKIRSLPSASTDAYKPEPTLTDDDYDNIIKILRGMILVMERSPSAFESMDEESLRTHFLVQLNGHYEGQATGETFNYQGKTDILIRSDGNNIFIGECKFWRGKKKYLETIDQILSYSSWRDTKVAILVFNRNKNLSSVLSEIDISTAEHPNCKRMVAVTDETTFKYIFGSPVDANKELMVTVMVFDVPSRENAM